MYKLLLGVMWLFMVATLGSAIMEGGGGIVTTQLTRDMSAGDLSMNVTSTRGFLEQDWIWVSGEKVSYNATSPTSFNGLTRGYNSTTPVSHSVFEFVYTEDSGIINQAMGFNVLVTESTAGDFNALSFFQNFFSITLPRIILWDYAWIKLPGMQLFRVFGYAMSVALITSMALTLAQIAFGILRR